MSRFEGTAMDGVQVLTEALDHFYYVMCESAAYHKYLEYEGVTSSKFWEVTYDNGVITTRWGRVGKKGRSKTQRGTMGKARRMAEKKEDKGYVPVKKPSKSANAGPSQGIVKGRLWDLNKIRIPDEWGMFTRKGNRRLKKLATDAVNKLKKAAKSKDYQKRAKKVLEWYYKSWYKIGNTNSYAEAGDTAVRERVGGFLDTMAAAVYGSVSLADDHGADFDSIRNTIRI